MSRLARKTGGDAYGEHKKPSQALKLGLCMEQRESRDWSGGTCSHCGSKRGGSAKQIQRADSSADVLRLQQWRNPTDQEEDADSVVRKFSPVHVR